MTSYMKPNTLYLKKVQTCIKNIFGLHNDWNVIISKAEKVQICGKKKLLLHFFHIGSEMHYLLNCKKQLSDMRQ